MSGLNPFRPKKPEDHKGHQLSSPSISSSPKQPDPIFLRPSSNPTAAEPSPDPHASTTPPANTSAPAVDRPAHPDNQYISDPFSQNPDSSDDDDELQGTAGDSTRPPVPSSRSLSGTGSSEGRHTETNIQPDTGKTRKLRGGTSSRRSSTSSDTGSDSTTNEPGLYASAKEHGRPISLQPDMDSRVLAARPGNRDRVPPPPPKSHHGKLITPDLSISSPPPSRTTPGRVSSRASIHGSSPGPLSTSKTSQPGSDYFGTHQGQDASPTDALRRSQSQHKRPPTPPLSRRHSQMRRSKSTLSKPSSSQLSVSNAVDESLTSAPPSPGTQSLSPSLRSGGSRANSSIPVEASSSFSLRSENILPTPLQPTESRGSENQPNSRTSSKRLSLLNQVPPPPPPRRTRGSNLSVDNSRNSSLHLEQREDKPANYVPQPSNAMDILADLSRLQKEVDDYRGHFENWRDQ
ncbi:hypothetical protein BDV18DRAFT_140875 [Aspergillus unguis]